MAGIGDDTVLTQNGDDTIQFMADDAFSFSSTTVRQFGIYEGNVIVMFEDAILDFDAMVANNLRDDNGSAQIFDANFEITLEGISVAELSNPANGWEDHFIF